MSIRFHAVLHFLDRRNALYLQECVYRAMHLKYLNNHGEINLIYTGKDRNSNRTEKTSMQVYNEEKSLLSFLSRLVENCERELRFEFINGL